MQTPGMVANNHGAGNVKLSPIDMDPWLPNDVCLRMFLFPFCPGYVCRISSVTSFLARQQHTTYKVTLEALDSSLIPTSGGVTYRRLVDPIVAARLEISPNFVARELFFLSLLFPMTWMQAEPPLPLVWHLARSQKKEPVKSIGVSSEPDWEVGMNYASRRPCPRYSVRIVFFFFVTGSWEREASLHKQRQEKKRGRHGLTRLDVTHRMRSLHRISAGPRFFCRASYIHTTTTLVSGLTGTCHSHGLA